MQKRSVFLFLFMLFLLLTALFPLKIHSVECDPQAVAKCSGDQCRELETSCNQKATELSQQADTLSSQILYMDTQIYLTGIKIQETQEKIESTTKEIDILGSRIEGLDTSLTYLSKLLLQRVVQGYKQRAVSLFNILFDSDNAYDFISRIKYQKTAQENNQKLLVQVEQTKLNFEEQKKLREQKIQELDMLKTTLDNQKITLNSQKAAKQKLLTDTQNSEKIYRDLSIQARQQIAGFKSFFSSIGAGIINANQFGNGSDGNYYSQRDERWANRSIGYSNESILNVGCLVTSVAIAAKKLGSSVNPLDIASDVSRFFGNTAYMKLPWPSVGGKSYVSLSQSDANQELQNGNYVIAGIRRNSCASGGDHFVVLTKKDGDNYIMHDPIYGPDQKFYDHYSSFCSFATFR